ncbi:MAG: LOG family protein [Planctomycetota bacterium]
MSREDQIRQELNPAEATALRDESAAPGEQREQKRVDDPEVQRRLMDLIADVTHEDSRSFRGRLVRELLTAGLKLLPDGRDTGELKLMAAAVKELRYAYRVFAQYPNRKKITIFGSARTPEDHPDYLAAVEFSRLIAEAGWMSITGAGDGIMKAGHEGPGREKSFGVAIRLPFETTANEVIEGDDKLIHFRYFFTRKLMFLSQCDAVALFPGGFGTLDEAFEVLTLIQTGKSAMLPIVLVEGAESGTGYWEGWLEFVQQKLLGPGWISPEDPGLFTICPTPAAAVEEVQRFYRVYHSSRYVGDELVIRLNYPISDADVDRLNDGFSSLIRSGSITQRGPYEQEDDHLDLPRLSFHHTKHHFGLVRKLIDAVNACEPRGGEGADR